MWMFSRADRAPKSQYAQRQFQSLETFNHDGLVLARVRRTSRRPAALRQILLFGLAVIAFKLFLFLQMGEVAYTQKMEDLALGSSVEQTAAWAMQLDPMSAWLVDGIRYGTW